jgi:hypothetical protein
MPSRPALAATVALGAALLAVPAHAAPRSAPSCRLVTDAANDDVGAGSGTDAAFRDADLDIISADVATDASRLVAVIKTRTLRAADTDSPTGRTYDLTFVSGEQRYSVTAYIAPDGTDAQVAREDKRLPDEKSFARIGSGKVVWDYAHGEVRVTAPLSLFAPYTPITRSRPLHGFTVIASKHAGTGGNNVTQAGQTLQYGGGGLSTVVDDAASNRTYVPGTASCVAVR